jgi:hypothetical protein
MSGGDIETGAHEQVKQHHGVDAPADCYKDGVIVGAEIVFADELEELSLHKDKDNSLVVIR